MINFVRPAAAALLVLSLGACQKDTAPPATPPSPATTMSPAPSAPTTPAADPAPVTTPTATTGVAECDNFLFRYDACVSTNVPEAARAPFQQSSAQMRSAWIAAAAAPGGKDTLATTCAQARDAAKASLAQYGCTDF